MLVKFESDNPGGSHKVRAARYIIRSALERGLIVPGQTTVIEKTGGNFGLGLVLACTEHGIPVELAIGLSFSPVKRRYLEWVGARLVGVEQLAKGAKPREVVEERLARAREAGRSCFFPDQFNNPACVDAHEFDTGQEIASQLARWPGLRQVRLVACAGTGAHLTGIARALLRAGYALDVTLVEPAGCDTRQGHFIDHPIEGMSVGVKPPLLDWQLVNRTASVTVDAMLQAQQWMATCCGFMVGKTSAACLAVARSQALESTPWCRVLTLAYDHGLWYR